MPLEPLACSTAAATAAVVAVAVGGTLAPVLNGGRERATIVRLMERVRTKSTAAVVDAISHFLLRPLSACGRGGRGEGGRVGGAV